MFKFSVALITATLIQMAFSDPLPLRGRDVADASAESYYPSYPWRRSNDQPMETQMPDDKTKAANDETFALAARDVDLIGPNEHTGLAGTADHLGVALAELGEGLGDLL